MLERLQVRIEWLLGLERPDGRHPGHLWPRWIFLRALGLIYFSAFYSFLFQVKGLLGPDGILPARDYLEAVAAALRAERFWFAPTLLWFNSSNHALMLLCWVGLLASVLVVFNVWPRASLVACFVCFLSLIAAAQDFASYQSDGMLLEAGILCLFFAPSGFLPGLGRSGGPSRASLYMLRWEWFRILFGSGVGKIASGDQSWRHLTALDDYYQNGPLPTWIGWYVQQWPHWFQHLTAAFTLGTELLLVWAIFLPRRYRIICFWIITPFQVGIILTANYTFLNYLVLFLGFLLLDDLFLERVLPARFRNFVTRRQTAGALSRDSASQPAGIFSSRARWREPLAALALVAPAFCMALMFYSSAAQLIWRVLPRLPIPDGPVRLLMPFRIADRYGLFETMTHARYEIEFQGTSDGKTWLSYPFRYKPQDVNKAPGIYAPYQPRFEWNLWFASISSWNENRWVVWTEERLLRNQPDVLALFAANPFAGAPPSEVRTVIYQYWFTDSKIKRATGRWWRRELLGEYSPALEREPDGKVVMIEAAPAVTPAQP
ncbi:MAG: lipase maturation factor family protein [Candidatus Acidiferrales bacterium]